MTRVPWLRSIYWRIALACVGLLAAGRVAHLAVVLLTLSRPEGLRARVAAQQVAEAAARDLSASLEDDPAVDVREVMRRHVPDAGVPIFLVTPGGSVTGTEAWPPPPPVVRRVLEFLEQPDALTRPDRPFGLARVDVLGTLEGHIVVLPRRPGLAVFRDLGVWSFGGAAVLTIVVAGLLAWLAFRPAHRRLRALEAAATRLGQGDLSARAPEDGADEISRVSRAFNLTAQALTEQIHRAATEQEVRRQLLADVSHELHTPLTAIRGYVETLRLHDAQVDPAARARYLTIVDDEAVRLERLIGDLLDLAKMEAGGQGLRPERLQLQTLWDRLRDRHTPAAEAAGVALTFAPTTLEVRADPGRLEQALSNLIANALRFTPDRGAVDVAAHADGDMVHLEVTDSGVGLSPDQQARVFERFYKQDASRSRGGTGLGLSIVRAIAEAHGGTASVRSTPGQGSTFAISAPLRAE